MKNIKLFGTDIKYLILPSVLGASIPLVLLALFVLVNLDSFAPWMFFPLLIVPCGGAAGGIFFYFMGFQWFPRGTQKLIALIFSTVIYFIAIWISSVIAFNFTGHWN
jgi:hypothetical protein